MQNTAFSTNKTLNINGQLLDLSTPKVMGILNITPDSFYGGSRFNDEKAILERAEKMVAEGATFLDIGGYSSRPGATDISQEEEIVRIKKAIRPIKVRFPQTVISIDTFRSGVAMVAREEGAGMVNDISGGQLDASMFSFIAKAKLPYVMMHTRGTPQTMTQLTQYENLTREVLDFFHSRVQQLTELGVKDCILDPGFGFAKTREQNFQLLGQLEVLKMLGRPLLVGLSRKSMIWKTLEITPGEALNGTTALHAVALMKGASILRVHDVKEAIEAIKLISLLPDNAFHELE